MARKSKNSFDELLAIEKAADDRKNSRATGFAKMHERDKSWHRLSNGVIIAWPVNRKIEEGEVRKHVPEGHFLLVINGKEILFDADEFSRWIRWV